MKKRRLDFIFLFIILLSIYAFFLPLLIFIGSMP